MPEIVRQELLPERETRLNLVENKFVELMRRYLRTYNGVTIQGPEVSPRVTGQYIGVKEIIEGWSNYPLLPSKDKVYDLLTTTDGYNLIVVPVGQKLVIADLDKKTAIATLHLHGCKGIGFRFIGSERDSSRYQSRLLYGLGHFNYDQAVVLGEIVDLANPKCFSFVSVVWEPIRPATKALLVTSSGGVIFREYGHRLTPTYRWLWE